MHFFKFHFFTVAIEHLCTGSGRKSRKVIKTVTLLMAELSGERKRLEF